MTDLHVEIVFCLLMTFSKEKVLTQNVCQDDLNVGIFVVCGRYPN